MTEAELYYTKSGDNAHMFTVRNRECLKVLGANVTKEFYGAVPLMQVLAFSLEMNC